MKKFSLFCGLVFLFLSGSVAAHLKWFVPESASIVLVNSYSFLSTEFIVGIIFCVIIFFITFILKDHITERYNDDKWGSSALIFRIFSGLIGVSLLISAYSEVVFAAHYVVNSPILVVLQYIQAIAGLMLVLGIFSQAAAYFLIIIYVALSAQLGWIELLDYLNIIGIAVFIVLYKNKKHQQFALPGLRVFTGLALIVLSFSEKLIDQSMGVSFLSVYPWNFMQGFGFQNYSDTLFVLSAGFVELLLGLLLVFGLLTRLVTAVLVLFMITSNVAFLIQNAMSNAVIEVVGHLPVIAIAIILIAFGAGKRWRL